jgi:hypothetical protein
VDDDGDDDYDTDDGGDDDNDADAGENKRSGKRKAVDEEPCEGWYNGPRLEEFPQPTDLPTL